MAPQAVLQGYNASPVGGIGRHDQPAGAAEGLRQASAELRSGFGTAAQAVVVRPARTLQQDGVAAAFGERVASKYNVRIGHGRLAA